MEKFKKKVSKKQSNKKGRKSQWPENTVNDLVDVIIDNEKYKEKLLLTNIKNAKNGKYYEKVIQEVRERCESRGEEYSFDVMTAKI